MRRCRTRLPCAGRRERRARWSTREWLVTNGLGGYASGTVAGVLTRRYHGLLDRRAARAPRPHGDAQPPRRSSCGCPTARRVAARRRGSRGPRRAARRAAPDRVPPRERPAGLALRGRRRSSSRSACSCRTGRTPCTSPTGCSTAPAAVALDAAAVGALPRRTTRRVSEPLAGPYRVTRGRRSLRDLRRADDLPPLRLPLHGDRRAFTARRARDAPSVLYRVEAQPRLRVARRRCGAPATSAPTSAPATTSTLVASTEPWETVARARRRPRRCAGRATTRRARLLGAPRIRRAHAASARELVLAADQFIITPGRPRRGRGARARRRRRGRAPSSPAITGSPTGAATR